MITVENSTPNVSVVMSAYNALPYLAEAVDSILSQSYRDFELIVTDDGSTDGTREALRKYEARDPRVRLILNSSNQGFARSQNGGFRIARGQFIAFHDADDVSQPSRLEKQVSFLLSHPEVGLVGTWPEFTDQSGHTINEPDFNRVTDNLSLQAGLFGSYCFCAGSIMVRRPILLRSKGFNPEMVAHEDYDLLLRLAEITKLANLPEELYRYRQHTSSVSRQRQHIQMFTNALAKEQALARRFGDTPPARLKDLTVRRYLRAALVGHGNGDAAVAKTAFDRACRLEPRILLEGAYIKDELRRYFARCGDTQVEMEAASLAADLFSGDFLPVELTRQVIAERRLAPIFRAQGQLSLLELVTAWYRGITASPKMLENRGLWRAFGSQLVRSLLAHHVLP